MLADLARQFQDKTRELEVKERKAISFEYKGDGLFTKLYYEVTNFRLTMDDYNIRIIVIIVYAVSWRAVFFVQ